MANGFKTGGRDFQPGQSGNPYGRGVPGVPMPNLLFKTLGTIEFREIVKFLFYSKRSDWERIDASDDEEGIKRIVAGLLIHAHDKRCVRTFESLLDRVIGKPKEMPDDDAKGDAPARTYTIEEVKQLISFAREKK